MCVCVCVPPARARRELSAVVIGIRNAGNVLFIVVTASVVDDDDLRLFFLWESRCEDCEYVHFSAMRGVPPFLLAVFFF